jgi:hypothetical protein
MAWTVTTLPLPAAIILKTYLHIPNTGTGDIETSVLVIAVLQAGRSRVRFPIMSLEFFIDIILPVPLWPWGRHSL